MRTFILLVLLAILAGCGTSPTDPGNPIQGEGVSIGVMASKTTDWSIGSGSFYWIGTTACAITKEGTAQVGDAQKVLTLGRGVTKVNLLFGAFGAMTVILYKDNVEVHRENVVQGESTIIWDF